MTVSEEKRYENITRQIQYHNEKIIQAFKLFIQTLSAIVGGSIWLAIKNSNSHDKTYWLLADILVACLAILTLVTVSVNLIAWFGFRRAEHSLNPKAPNPGHIQSYWNELVMMAVILLVSCLYFVFNPL